jgi:adenylyltransferase/sulfurtransferase
VSPNEVPLEVDVTEAARLLQAAGRVLLLDVRELHERTICHVKDSLHIPMSKIPERLAELPKNRHILVLCHHGGRSQRVTQFLRANDYTLVTNVAGGIHAWAEAVAPGMPRY